MINLNYTFISACSGAILVEVSKKLTLTDKKLERFNASHTYKNVGMILSSVLRGFIIEIFGIKIKHRSQKLEIKQPTVINCGLSDERRIAQ